MSEAAQSRFVEVGAREVHYLIGGEGVPLVMLHQSPRSAAEFAPLIAHWGRDFRCIAPDMPGFGRSSPLSKQARLDDFADALARFMDAIGLERALLYGEHTGAILALAAAALHPDRFAAIVAHGYAIWTEEEQREFGEQYLPPLVPDMSGSHLVWLWARNRAQRRFFPWYRQTDATRIHYGVPSPEDLHAESLDFLRAGDDYRTGYRAAFEADAARVSELRAPTLLIANETDPLVVHLDRLPPLPPQVEVRRTPDWASAQAASHEWLRSRRVQLEWGGPPASARHLQIPVAIDGYAALLHVEGPSGAATRELIVHEPGGSARTALAGAGPGAAALDLPGHGLSLATPLPTDASSWPRLIDATAQALGLEPGTHPIELRGPTMAFSTFLEARGWTVLGERPRALDEPDLAEKWLPDLTPDSVGSHLLRAWEAVRDREIFDPPWQHDPDAWRPLGDLEPATISARHLALLEAKGAAPMLAACAAFA